MQQDVASFMSAEGEALGTSEGVALGTHEVESRLEAAKVEDLRAQLDRLSISEVEDYLQNRKTLSKAPSLASQTSSITPTTGSVNGTIADRRATLFEQLRPFGYQGRGLLLRPFVQRPSLQLPNGKRESSMGFPNCGGNVSSTGAMTETQTSTNAPAAGAMDKTAAPSAASHDTKNTMSTEEVKELRKHLQNRKYLTSSEIMHWTSGTDFYEALELFYQALPHDIRIVIDSSDTPTAQIPRSSIRPRSSTHATSQLIFPPGRLAPTRCKTAYIRL